MVSASSVSTRGRELRRRYRAPLIAAIPAGAVLGVIADLVFAISTVQATPQDRIPALLAYTGLGATVALVACIGAVLAVLVGRPRPETLAAQCWYITAGAGAAVCTGALAAGALSAAITDSWEWYSFFAVVAIGTGVAAAVCAGGITAFFLYRPRHRRQQRSPSRPAHGPVRLPASALPARGDRRGGRTGASFALACGTPPPSEEGRPLSADADLPVRRDGWWDGALRRDDGAHRRASRVAPGGSTVDPRTRSSHAIAISPLFPAAAAEIIALGFLHSALERPETVDALGSALVTSGLILLAGAVIVTAVVTMLLARRDQHRLTARGASGRFLWGSGLVGGVYLTRRALLLREAGVRAIAPAVIWWVIVASALLALVAQGCGWTWIALHHTFSGA